MTSPTAQKQERRTSQRLQTFKNKTHFTPPIAVRKQTLSRILRQNGAPEVTHEITSGNL